MKIKFTKKSKNEPQEFFDWVLNAAEHIDREEKNDGRSDDRAWSILLDAEQKGLIKVK
jgi:hypothetical protein